MVWCKHGAEQVLTGIADGEGTVARAIIGRDACDGN